MKLVYPSFLYCVTWDLFSVVRCWRVIARTASERGRMFEQMFYKYCEMRNLPLVETAGSRTLNGVRAASGLLHENDAVIATPNLNIHVELKHLSEPVRKIDLVSFNQKALDFLAADDARIRKKPLIRILASGTSLEPAARMFAAQWGILAIEPDRLPLLAIEHFAVHHARDCGAEIDGAAQILSETRYVVVPLQERVRMLAAALDGAPTLGKFRIERILQLQERYGSYCWRMLDRQIPMWIETRYKKILKASGVRFSYPSLREHSRQISDARSCAGTLSRQQGGILSHAGTCSRTIGAQTP